MSDVWYAVRQIDWVRSEYGDKFFRRTPRGVVVATFPTFDEADADRRVREAEFRRRANPFRYGGAALFYQTSLDAPRLHDWLLDGGIDPPAYKFSHESWAEWWDEFAHTWTTDQRAHAWQAIDKVRFFEVVEQHPARKAYVVLEINWTWNDEPYLDADYEGGNAVRAFRSRAKAEAECYRLNRERQQQQQHAGYDHFRLPPRPGYDPEPYTRPIAETVFFEVVEIELGDEA
jgi:hypothetical protein